MVLIFEINVLLRFTTAHACWDVTGYSDPFRPLKVPICGRLLEGVHKKKAVPGGCPIAKTGHQKGKRREIQDFFFKLQRPYSPPTYQFISDRLPALCT